jgi:hypothetical protein
MALTILPTRIDGRLTALWHACGDETAVDQVERMNIEQQSHERDPAGESPARATHHEEHWSYLLRLWRSGGSGALRASLQSIPAGERHMFADLESLLAFLSSLSQ